MSDVETFFLCPLSHLLEEERKAWANQIGIMVIVNPLAQLDGDSEWVRYSDYARLKAEVERLRASSFVTAVPVEEYEKLKAEVERLKKGGLS